MIIERIAIGSFGNLCGVEYLLGEGLNVFVGPNESGKSMLAAFIRYMLYGFGTQTAPGDLSEREKRVNWQTRKAEGEMDVRLRDGRRLRIFRCTEAKEQAGRTVYREESSMTDLADGSVTRFPSRPGEEFFGVPEQVYVNTAFFDQLSASRINESETAQAMENLLFSGDERVSSLRALKTMREARYSLSHPSGVGGAIYELMAQTDATRMRLTQAMRRSAQIHKTETELHKLSERIAKAEAERDRLVEVDSYYRGYLTICLFDKLHEVESAHSELSERRERLHRENENGDFLPTERYLTELQTAERVTEIARQNYLRTEEKLGSVRAAERVDARAEELFRLTEEEGGTAAVEERYHSLHRRARRYRFVGWTLAVLSLLLLGVGTFLFRPFVLSPGLALVLLASLSLLVLSGAFFSNRRKTLAAVLALCRRFEAASGADLLCLMNDVVTTRREMDERRESVLRAEENAEISRANYETLYAELFELAGRWDKHPLPPASESMLDTISPYVREFLDEDRRLGEELAEVRGRMMALREELEGESEIAIRAQVPPARREAMKKIVYKTVQEGLNYYRTACDSLHAQRDALLGEWNEYRKTAENPALLRTELAAMEERVAGLRRRYRAYGIASDAIDSASDRLRAEISPRLSEFAGDLLAKATDGRYDTLEVSNRLSVAYRKGELVRPVPSMSASVSEIAYIALRLALIDMLYEEMPPLCFDGSLTHQDDGRTANMIRLLSEIAEGGMQSILFTCHTHKAELAAAIAEGTRCLTL